MYRSIKHSLRIKVEVKAKAKRKIMYRWIVDDDNHL